MNKRYINVGIPESLIKKVDFIVKQDKFGYSSRSEVVKDAVRKLTKELLGE